ncbi:MAG: hypothetical protein CVV00_09355 [Firmicutes bacterium HGW-Firmicutes-5]|nr:MAG: hypothetical protein CVV00_09355 [Firmicutes bacterium HGW-Firmicutes-5]
MIVSIYRKVKYESIYNNEMQNKPIMIIKLTVSYENILNLLQYYEVINLIDLLLLKVKVIRIKYST